MIPDPTDKATDGMLPAPACSPSSDTPFIDAYLVATLCKYGTLDEYTAPKDWVMVARKLERERNDARSQAQLLRDLLQNSKWPKHRFPWENVKEHAPLSAEGERRSRG